MVFAEVGLGHPQVPWLSPHPCAQSSPRDFRRCSWSNGPCLQSHVCGSQEGSHIPPTTTWDQGQPLL